MQLSGKFRRTNRLAEIRWGTTRTHIENGVRELEEKAFAELPAIDKMALEMYNAAKGKPAEQMHEVIQNRKPTVYSSPTTLTTLPGQQCRDGGKWEISSSQCLQEVCNI
jgi:hypothetical protein